MRLFAERGYEATTVAQIAEAAEVSPRTVSLYFPSKLDLALSYIADSAQRLSDACANRSADETIPDLLSGWLQDEARSHGETLRLLRAMLAANPALRGAETSTIAESRRSVNVALAADLGRVTDDAVVVLVNGAMAGIISSLMQIGSDETDGVDALEVATRLMRAVVRSAQADTVAEVSA